MAGLTFLELVDDLAAEIEERLPGYFRRQPLRCVATGAHAEVCRNIARACDLPLLPVADGSDLNAVDRQLRDRLAAAGASVTVERGDMESLKAFRLGRMQARAAAAVRVTAIQRALGRRAAANAPSLGYAEFGRGEPPIVAINAIGQTLTAWLPLVERLSRRRRVVLWNLREFDSTGRPIGFAEHCNDLHSILELAHARRCHLLGWCTGAKLAARYCRTHPDAVVSMIFLSGSFKHPGRPRELDTGYERNLEAMLQAVVHQPALAERLLPLLAEASSSAADSDRMNGDELACSALTGVPAGLRQDVCRPFRDAAALLVYAGQHLEFWAHDETATASKVPVPTLGLAGEHDRIVSLDGFRDALACFPRSRFELIPGATHFAHFERANDVAMRIEEWVETAQ